MSKYIEGFIKRFIGQVEDEAETETETYNNYMENLRNTHRAHISGVRKADSYYSNFLEIMGEKKPENITPENLARLVDITVDIYHTNLYKEKLISDSLVGNKELFEIDDELLIDRIAIELKLTTFQGVYGLGKHRYLFDKEQDKLLRELIMYTRKVYLSDNIQDYLYLIYKFLGVNKFTSNILYNKNVDYYINPISKGKLKNALKSLNSLESQ